MYILLSLVWSSEDIKMIPYEKMTKFIIKNNVKRIIFFENVFFIKISYKIIKIKNAPNAPRAVVLIPIERASAREEK